MTHFISAPFRTPPACLFGSKLGRKVQRRLRVPELRSERAETADREYFGLQQNLLLPCRGTCMNRRCLGL